MDYLPVFSCHVVKDTGGILAGYGLIARVLIFVTVVYSEDFLA